MPPPHPRTPRRFLVTGMQRSGTSVTHACLRGHPHVASHPDELHVSLFSTRPPHALEAPPHHRHDYLTLFDRLARDDPLAPPPDVTSAHGLKTAVGSHRDALDLAACLRDHLPDVAVILTHRHDLVAQLGSLLRAQRSGRWHSHDRTDRPPGPVTIDPQRFTAYVTDARRAVAQLRTLGDTHPLLELSYEDDVVPARWQRLFAFLGLADLPVDWLRMTKVAPEPRSYITNYDELHAILAGMPSASPDAERAAALAHRHDSTRTDSPLLLAHRAKAALQDDDPGAAHADAMAGLALCAGPRPDPDTASWLLRMLEDAWYAAGDAELAHRSLRELERAWASHPSFLVLRAAVAAHLGDRDAARADLARALALDPQHPRARELARAWSGDSGG